MNASCFVHILLIIRIKIPIWLSDFRRDRRRWSQKREDAGRKVISNVGQDSVWALGIELLQLMANMITGQLLVFCSTMLLAGQP